ncbi:MAG: hypothetical protein ACFFEN_05090 [Candidatus Thorarchaeota archaeon]
MDKKMERKAMKAKHKEFVRSLLYSNCNDIQCWSFENKWSLYNQYLSRCRC